MPIPSLVAILLRAERDKGTPLLESEVYAIRDNCVCIAMRKSHASAVAEKRGYDDIDPERCWEQWQVVRKQFF